MADDSGLLREFFFKLGFKVNDAAQAAFDGAMVKSTALGVAMGELLFAGAKKAVGAVEELAEGYEKLYFASKRTGATAAEITDLSLSLRNAGVDAQTTMTTLEGLAQFRRTQFASDPILLGLGVKPEDLKDPKKILDDLVTKGRETYGNTDLGYKEFNARIQAALPGVIPEPLLNAAYHEYAPADTTAEDMEKRTGVSMNDAASAAHDMNSGLRDLDVIVKSELTPAFKAASDTIAAALDRVNGTVTSDDHNLVTDWAATPTGGKKALDKAINDTDDATDRVIGSIVGHMGLYTGAGDKEAQSKAQSAVDRLIADGIPRVQAVGMVAEAWGETGGTFDPKAFNPKGGGRGAEGVFQLRGSRIDDFKAVYGHDPLQGTVQEQLDFAAMEVLRGNERKNASEFLAAKDYQHAGLHYSKDIARTGNAGFDNMNAARAVGIGARTVSTTINVTVAPGSDAKAQGKAAGDAFNTQTASTVRNFTQAGH